MASSDEITVKGELGRIAVVEATNRQALVDSLNYCASLIVYAEGLKEGKPLLHVELSGCEKQIGCSGGSVDYMTIDDIPLHSVPCPCGNPKHWLIKYEEEDK